jgi:hypothetical protein
MRLAGEDAAGDAPAAEVRGDSDNPHLLVEFALPSELER